MRFLTRDIVLLFALALLTAVLPPKSVAVLEIE